MVDSQGGGEQSRDHDPRQLDAIVEEFVSRLRRGEEPSVETYAVRFPRLAQEIRELLPTLAMLEDGSDEQRPAPQPARPMPPQLGEYRIVREIGRGGMGIVYEAEQQSLKRRVALKVLVSGAAGDEIARERFRREARAAARLHHTNIVPVHDVGEEGTTSFYVMQFIDGKPLDKIVRELCQRTWSGRLRNRSTVAPSPSASTTLRLAREPGGTLTTAVTIDRSVDPLPADSRQAFEPPQPVEFVSRYDSQAEYFQSVAELGAQVADVLAYAHGRGVVHRDIKPSNLLLDSAGVVWLTDFGMAKTEAEPLTRTGDILGTLHYMAPERFRGECDARADIYAVGLTVYELLCLQRAFASEDRLQLVEMICQQEPPRPRAVNSAIPRDLETIVLKAIDKDPRRRYPTAEALADDFQCFLEDRPIRARGISSVERFVRWSRKNVMLSVLSMSMVAILMLAAVGATVTAWTLEQSRDRAITAEARAVRNREIAEASAQRSAEDAARLREQDYVNRVNLAYLEFRNDNVARALEQLHGCPPELRGWEWQFVAAQCQVALRSTRELRQSVNGLDFSPDGRWLLVGTGNFLHRRGAPGDLLVRDTWDNSVKHAFEAIPDGVSAVAFSPDGQRFAAASGRRFTVWDFESGASLFSHQAEELDCLCLEFSPDGQQLAAGFGRFNGSDVGYAVVWDVATGRPNGERLAGHRSGVWSLSFAPDGKRLALSSSGVVDVWDLALRQTTSKLTGDFGFLYCVQFHPEGRLLAAGGLDRVIRLWDTESQQLVRRFTGHTGFVRGLAFRPDGQQLVSASEDKSLRLWDIESERELATFRGHTHFVNCVAFSSHGDVFASGGLDQTVRVWFAATDQQLIYRGHVSEGHAAAIAFSPTDDAIASGSKFFAGPKGRLHLWDPDTGQRRLDFPGQVGEVASLAFRADGARLAAGHVDGTITLWDALTAQQLLRIPAHVGEVAAVAFHPDGDQLASVGRDQGLNLWDAANGDLVRGRVLMGGSLTDVAFSPDGGLLAVSGTDGRVEVWEAESGDSRATFQHHGEAHALAFGPDGRWLVSTGGRHHREGELRVWDLAPTERHYALTGHTDIVHDVAFSPDGRRFVTASDDRTVKIWSLGASNELFTMRGHTGGVISVSFSSDGRRLASGSVDRTVRVWSLQPPDAAVHSRRAAVATMERAEQLVAAGVWDEALKSYERAAELGLDGPGLRWGRLRAAAHLRPLDEADDWVSDRFDQLAAPASARQALRLADAGYLDAGRRFAARAVSVATEDPTDVDRSGAHSRRAGTARRGRAELPASDCFARGAQRSGPLADGDGWWWRAASQPPVSPLPNAPAATAGTSDADGRWEVLLADGDGNLQVEPRAGGDLYLAEHLYASGEQSVVLLVESPRSSACRSMADTFISRDGARGVSSGQSVFRSLPAGTPCWSESAAANAQRSSTCESAIKPASAHVR